MATYYVGPGGNDGNSGLTWALRKLTLNGAEDVPVVADDTVLVGPGVYREELTIDVSGGAGTPITYIGDITGRLTDGVGGTVRLTGSDNDQAIARNTGIFGSNRDYRTFRGFDFDSVNWDLINADSCDNWIIEDCTFQSWGLDGIASYNGGTDWTIRRCVFIAGADGITFRALATVNNSGHLVENCLFIGLTDDGIGIEFMGDMTVKNCLLIGCGGDSIDVRDSPNAGHPVLVYNSQFVTASSNALEAAALGDMTENYNNFYANKTDRTNVAVGANSQVYLPLLAMPMLLDGYRFPPPLLGELSQWSALRRITGTATATDDLFGFTRPTTGTKKSWGALQFQDKERDTGTVYASSTASLELPDAGIVQFVVPVDPVETTIQVRVNRQANYAGNAPRMIIREPGQSDRNSPDPGAASVWNLLTDTFTPTGDTDFVTVLLQSRNTAIAGNYAVFFDDLFVR